MTKPNKNLVVNSWLEEYLDTIAKETILIFRNIKTTGSDLTYKVAAIYLRFLLREIMLQELNKYAKNENRKEAFEQTRKHFLDVKIYVQNEIGNAFEQALTQFTGRPIEYYCSITEIPEMKSKEIN